MFRAMYRQRRRVLVSTFFALLILYLAGGPMMHELTAGSPLLVQTLFFVITFLIFGAMIATGIAVLVVLFPVIRVNAEFMGLVFFLLGLIDLYLPDEFNTQYPLVYLVGFFGTIFGLQQLMYGHALDRFPMRLLNPSKRGFVSPKPADALWAELVPGAGEVGQYWVQNLTEIAPHDGKPNQFKARFALGGGAFVHRIFVIEIADTGRHCRYRYADEVSSRNLPQNSGTVDITLTPAKTGTRVTFEDRPDAQLPRDALYNWMDDIAGDELDHIRARQLGRWDWTITGRHQRLIARLS
jgi:hypothetical protein